MQARGLQSDFSEAALRQAQSITQAAADRAQSIRDQRELLWASIDNDDSRDLDQLSVAQPLDGGRVKILVAIAVAQSLKRVRHAHGALGLDSIEARAVFDGALLSDLRTRMKATEPKS